MKLFHDGSQPGWQDLFQSVNLAVLLLAVLMIGLSLAQTFIRFSLPTDGWIYARDATGTGQRFTFEQKLSPLPSNIQPGDMLVGIEGQSIEKVLSNTLSFSPQRPQNWEVGNNVQYSVLRLGKPLVAYVQLVRLSTGLVLDRLMMNQVRNPAPLLMLVIALVVFLRKPASPAARLLLLFGAAVFSSTGINQGVTGTNIIGPAEMFYRSVYWPTQVFNALIWPFVIAPLYLHLFLLFPIIKAPLRLHPRLTLVSLYGWMPVLTLLAALLHPNDPLGFLQAWSTLSFADFVLVILLAILIMVHNLANARGGTAQAQIRWIVFGTIITSLSALAGNLLASFGIQGEAFLAGWFVSQLLMLALPVAMAIAILRYHLFDIDIFINRTLVYGTLTILLGLVYFGSVIVLQFLFRSLTQATSQPAVVASTLAIAVLFNPLRKRVQDWVNLRFYRRKYNAARALEQFSKNLALEVEQEKLIRQMLKVVDETIQPESISLWMAPVQEQHMELED